MRKQLIPPTSETVRPHGEGWLDLERAATVEVTSEEENFPIECALASGETRGWRAAVPGTQTIRLVFDQPQRLRRISVSFEISFSRTASEPVTTGPSHWSQE